MGQGGLALGLWTVALLAACNRGPEAFPLTLTVLEDSTPTEPTPFPIELHGSERLQYVLTVPPLNGEVEFVGAQGFLYTPDPDFSGSDRFAWRALNQDVQTEPSRVTIEVEAVNDTPVPEPGTLVVGQNDPDGADGTLVATDVDSTLLSYAITFPPEHGTVTLLGAGAFRYVPELDYIGPDRFLFAAGDGQVQSAPAPVDVTVLDASGAPVAQGATFTVDEDALLHVNDALGKPAKLVAFDETNDPLTFTILQQAAHGTVVLTDARAGTFDYRGDQDYNGGDLFTFTASDGVFTSAPATVQITVRPVNDAPVPIDGVIGPVAEDAVSSTWQLDAVDVDFDTLTFAVLTQPAHGQAGVTDAAAGTVAYTPAPNFFGTDTFTFSVTDGIASPAVGTMSVVVTGVNDRPEARSGVLSIPEDAVGGRAFMTGYDPDGDPMTYEIVSMPAAGTLSLVDAATGEIAYTPPKDFNGSHTFTYRVRDAVSTSLVGTQELKVQPVNDVPLAFGENYDTFGNAILTIPAATGLLANDSDIDSTLRVVDGEFETTLGGHVTIAQDGSFVYRPPYAISGAIDQFAYDIVGDPESTPHPSCQIAIDGRLWFVDNTQTDEEANGYSDSPFATLAAATAVAIEGDGFYLYRGNGTSQALDQGVVLKRNQLLLGAGAELRAGDTVVIPKGLAPSLSNSSGGPVVTMADGTTVAGVNLAASSSAAIVADNVTTVVVTDATITPGTGGAVRATNTEAVTLRRVVSDRGLGAAIRLVQIKNTVEIDDCRINQPTGNGIEIVNSTTAFPVSVHVVDTHVIGFPGSTGPVLNGLDVAMSAPGGLDLLVEGSLFERTTTNAIELRLTGTSPGDALIDIVDATVRGTDGGGYVVSASGNASAIVRVQGGTLDGGVSEAIGADALEAIRVTAADDSEVDVTLDGVVVDDFRIRGVALESRDTAGMRAAILGSDVATDASVPAFTGNGIRATVAGTGALDLHLTGNLVTRTTGAGIVVITPEATPGSKLRAMVSGNDSGSGYAVTAGTQGTLEIGGVLGVGSELAGVDGGNIANNGNGSNGVAPTLTVTGLIRIVDPASIASPAELP